MVDLQPGAIFAGDYRIVRLLAEGGMGAVYVVEQLSTGKPRALKMMLPELAADEGLRKRFELEAKIGAKIESDHLVEIHKAGIDETSGAPYIVMELLAGEDLDQRVARKGPLSPGDAALVLEQLCHAVGAAHAVGIVHRDLKPHNVFLAEKKRAGSDAAIEVKVLDFGIAKLVAEHATHANATQGAIGTPLWMAPEQAERGPIGPQADVWALGLILYHALTGRTFWRTGSDPQATYPQILKEVVLSPIPAASARAREDGCADLFPAALDPVLARCLDRDAGRRFSNARELALAIARVLTPSKAITKAGAHAVTPAELGGAKTQVAEAASARTDYVPPSPAAIGPARVFIPPVPPQRPPSSALPRIAIVIAAVIGLFAFTCGVRTFVARAGARRLRQSPSTPIVVAPVTTVVSPRVCRLCTTAVTANGPLARDVVQSSVERAFPRLDVECLTVSGRRRIAPGTTTLTFNIVDGRPTQRAVEATSSPDKTDECLVRAMSEVTFPSAPDPTAVSYTLQYDPRQR
jgi:serine/threonine-protein kinase